MKFRGKLEPRTKLFRWGHKIGEITKIHHDAATVFAKRPFILVILVRGPAEKKYRAPLMADVSKILYQAVE